MKAKDFDFEQLIGDESEILDEMIEDGRVSEDEMGKAAEIMVKAIKAAQKAFKESVKEQLKKK